MADSSPKVHYDPRMGDEGSDEELPSPTSLRQARKRVTMDRHPTFDDSEPRRYPSSQDTESMFQEKDKESEREKPPRLSVGQWILQNSPVNLQWIPTNLSWSKFKPVLRSALTAWISVLFFIIPKLERTLGSVCRPLQFVFFRCPSSFHPLSVLRLSDSSHRLLFKRGFAPHLPGSEKLLTRILLGELPHSSRYASLDQVLALGTYLTSASSCISSASSRAVYTGL